MSGAPDRAAAEESRADVTAAGEDVAVRVAAAGSLLAREGVVAEVSAAGRSDEILAIRAAPSQRARLASLAPALRSLGFRYVGLDVDAEADKDIEDT